VFELSPLSIVRSNRLARLNVESGISPLCLQIYFCTNTGHRRPPIVEGSEADLWLEGRKVGSSFVYGALESRVVISSGNEVVETNPSSSRQHLRCVANLVLQLYLY